VKYEVRKHNLNDWINTYSFLDKSSFFIIIILG
jgi:hypothetical protein